jgi:hypothetical protein
MMNDMVLLENDMKSGNASGERTEGNSGMKLELALRTSFGFEEMKTRLLIEVGVILLK